MRWGGDKTASPDQAATIAAFTVARAVAQQIAADEAAGSNGAADHSAGKGDDKRTARDQHSAAYDAAYKAAYRIMGTGSKTPEYDECMAAYDAAKRQLIQDHVEPDRRLVAELAITALYDAGRDWSAKQPRKWD